MNENGYDGGTSADFNAASVETPAPEQDNFPSGEQLLEDGIKHDSAFDAWAAQEPEAPEYNNVPTLVDDSWHQAQAEARYDHEAMVETYRTEFHEQIHGHGQEFNERSDPDALPNQFNDRAIGSHLNHDRE